MGEHRYTKPTKNEPAAVIPVTVQDGNLQLICMTLPPVHFSSSIGQRRLAILSAADITLSQIKSIARPRMERKSRRFINRKAKASVGVWIHSPFTTKMETQSCVSNDPVNVATRMKNFQFTT